MIGRSRPQKKDALEGLEHEESGRNARTQRTCHGGQVVNIWGFGQVLHQGYLQKGGHTPRTGGVALRPPRDPACGSQKSLHAAESHKPMSVYHLSHRSTDMYSQIYVYITKYLYLAKKIAAWDVH